MEHTIYWIAIFYWIWGASTVIPPIIRDKPAIVNCSFDLLFDFNLIPWYRPFLIWIVFLFSELISIIINKETRYDAIKFIGCRGFNIFDNILCRMTGWYFFQIALLVPIVLFNHKGTPLQFDIY